MPFGIIGPQIVRTYKADAVLAAGVAVVAGAAVDSVALPAAQNDPPLGVTAAVSDGGSKVAVVEHGEVQAVADAAITRGDYVMINAATGKLAPMGAVGGTNYKVVGRALEAAAGQDSLFVMFVNPTIIQAQ
jgi:hypothetical protein